MRAYESAGGGASPVRVRARAMAARLRSPNPGPGALPQLRLRTRAGRWAVVHRSRMANPDTDAIATDIEKPSPAELAPALTVAYGLDEARAGAGGPRLSRPLDGRDRRQAAHTPDTIDDHLKSIFDKTGVSTRREIVAAIPRAVPAEGDAGAAPRVVGPPFTSYRAPPGAQSSSATTEADRYRCGRI
jgi:hypothetical protein